MTSSTLDLDGDETPVTTLGHGTSALGPSDSSDSGSDIAGGPGMDEGLDDDQSREMPQTIRQGAGRDIGDPDLDADSDRNGTGERGSSGIDSLPNDQKMTIQPGIESAADELDDPEAQGDAAADQAMVTDDLDDADGVVAARLDAAADSASDPDAAGDDDDLEDDVDADADARADEDSERREGSATVSDGAT